MATPNPLAHHAEQQDDHRHHAKTARCEPQVSVEPTQTLDLGVGIGGVEPVGERRDVAVPLGVDIRVCALDRVAVVPPRTIQVRSAGTKR
jgi:hypothetical protein